MKQDVKKSAIRRLKIIEGQARGLRNMIEQEKYCIDIITQIEAIREALSSIKNIILKNHLETHLLHQMKHGEEKKAVTEILEVYKLSQK